MPKRKAPRPAEKPAARATLPSGARATLRDIAAALGISTNTVSLALRNSPRISAATRDRVKRKARSIGYEPDPMLSALAHYRHNRTAKPVRAGLAWLNFWDEPKKLLEHTLYKDVWKGANEAARALGYSIEEFVCGGKDPIDARRLGTILGARGIRGILMPPQWPAPEPQDFKFDWGRYAVVRIGRTASFPPVDVVTHSQAHDMLTAVLKIHEKGYRRIGFVTGAGAPSAFLFDAGYLKGQRVVAESARLPVLELGLTDALVPEKVAAFRAWMKSNKPDAVISTYPRIRALAEAAGYRVPGDVALAAASVSLSDADAGNYENPEEVGRSAVRVLVGQLLRNEAGIPAYTHDILVRSQWVEGSTMPDKR